MSVLFILGSGTSVDSGLFTYRGDNSVKSKIITVDDDLETVWSNLDPLIKKVQEIKNNDLSPTYQLIQEIVNKTNNSKILTQNIDGIARKIKDIELIELHGNINEVECENCNYTTNYENSNMLCEVCHSRLRPSVIFVGEDLKVYNKAKKIVKNKFTHILIIGTTLQFPYLRELIGKAKQFGSKVIHINPDNDYDEKRIEINQTRMKYKKICNVRSDEILIRKFAAEGLQIFIENYLNHFINTLNGI